MKFLIKALGFAAVIMSSPLFAGEVNTGNVNSFASGNAALASEVNQNFNELISAINDNAQQIAQLKTDLTSLSVSGKTYKIFIHRLEIESRGTDGVSEEFTAVSGEEVTITLASDNTVTVTGTETSADVSSGILNVSTDGYSVSSGLTWQRNGNIVTIDDANDPEGGLTFLVAPGARTLVYLKREDASTAGSNYDNEIIIGVQAQTP